jgi:hypothetical protein
MPSARQVGMISSSGSRLHSEYSVCSAAIGCVAEARGRELLQVPGYRFHAVVTSLPTAPEAVWRTYNGRADSENRVKELKHAFGADGFCSRRFSGTEAALRFICLLYKLVGEFQRSLGHATLRTLATLRTTLFACGAILGADGRQRVLRLSRAKPWQATFLAYLQRLLPIPATAMQFRGHRLTDEVNCNVWVKMSGQVLLGREACLLGATTGILGRGGRGQRRGHVGIEGRRIVEIEEIF